VIIKRQRLLQAAFMHQRERRAIGKALTLVGPVAKQINRCLDLNLA
jgi:hypothetical protein